MFARIYHRSYKCSERDPRSGNPKNLNIWVLFAKMKRNVLGGQAHF